MRTADSGPVRAVAYTANAGKVEIGCEPGSPTVLVRSPEDWGAAGAPPSVVLLSIAGGSCIDLSRARSDFPSTPLIGLCHPQMPVPLTRDVLALDDIIFGKVSAHELATRIAIAKARRRSKLSAGPLVLNPVQHTARANGREVPLTRQEVRLLGYLINEAGRTISRKELASALWPSSSGTAHHVVDVYVCYLRQKLALLKCAHMLRTLRGAGYQLDPMGGS